MVLLLPWQWEQRLPELPPHHIQPSLITSVMSSGEGGYWLLPAYSVSSSSRYQIRRPGRRSTVSLISSPSWIMPRYREPWTLWHEMQVTKLFLVGPQSGAQRLFWFIPM